MDHTAFAAATLVLSLALGGCNSFLNATRDKPIDDDRGARTTNSKIDDSLVEAKIAADTVKTDSVLDKDSHIVMISYNGIVLTTSQTPCADLRSKAEQAARTVQKIKGVRNELQMTSSSSLPVRDSDTQITTKLGTQVLSDPNMPSSRIKVVTESGIVYMTGLVSQQEATQAVRVIQDIDGMQKIIRLLEYIG